MKIERTIKEWAKATGMSCSTCRRIFLKAGVVFDHDPTKAAKLSADVFRATAKELGFSTRRKEKFSVCSFFFDYLTTLINRDCGGVSDFCAKTGFERSRWYALAYGNSTKLTEKEAEILKGLLNV